MSNQFYSSSFQNSYTEIHFKYQRHPKLCFYSISSSSYVCSKKKLCAIYGKWTDCLYTVDPAAFDAHKKSDKKNLDEKKGNKQVLHCFKSLLCSASCSGWNVCLCVSVTPEQCGRGAGGGSSTWRWDGDGDPRKRAHLEDNATARQLCQGTGDRTTTLYSDLLWLFCDK